MTRTKTFATAAAIVLAIAGAGVQHAGQHGRRHRRRTCPAAIQIDGSSTVFPITEAIAEEFKAESPDVDVRVGQSGTGGGFEKFCAGETDISDASRPIEDDERRPPAHDESIEYVELKIAIDGLSVVVNKDNDFAECLTVDELKKIWEPESTVKTWKDVKAEWPAEEIKLYGPGADSGHVRLLHRRDQRRGRRHRGRTTHASEDDNVLVQGVTGDKNALGYFGYAYYEAEHRQAQAPSASTPATDASSRPTETIKDGAYAPLSRPLFIYASKRVARRRSTSPRSPSSTSTR